MSKRAFLLFSTLAFQVAIVGCSDKGQTDAERKGAELKKHCVEIECGVEEHRLAMRQSKGNPSVCGEKLARQIFALPSHELRRKYIERWADDVYSFDLGLLRYDGTGSSGFVWREITNFTEVMMRAWAGKSYEDKWDAYLRYFNWCRVQLSEFGKKRPYPNGAKPVWTRSGDIHWEISKEGRQAYQEFNWWIGSYNTFTEEYENSLWMKEIGKFPGDCESMSPDQANAIREKIEKFLGRKIRTKKEGEADWAAGRRREFPAYVATPEGIRECWTKAEEEAAKKKVK